VAVIPAQPDWVMALQFSPDGQSFAAGRFDGSLKIYPVASTTTLAAHQH
jgi:WD40 repeat protein